jgi:Vacuolar-sorting-associated 13 protein C-terminal
LKDPANLLIALNLPFQCLKSATVAHRNLSIKVDLAFLVRLQKFALELQGYFQYDDKDWQVRMRIPDIQSHIVALNAATTSGVGRQRIHFDGLAILPFNVKLSVAPARALTPAQAALEGAEAAAIHQAVRKGDVLLDRKRAGILGVKIGSRNKTPLAVVRGMLKSFVVDGLLRLDGASLNFAGVSLRNYTITGSQLTTALCAHYVASLRQNLPALVGSMAAFGNPLGLVRGTYNMHCLLVAVRHRVDAASFSCSQGWEKAWGTFSWS